ncbi:MAG TPA: hypothetical protein VFQ85_11815 [Mycobacteriales bacterium]|nr:hypothetical protein [Mycobacteriales bacterium]
MSSGQLSFFSAGARPAGVDDLDGLLCGPGQVVRQGDAARVSVIVREEWRVAALLDALAILGLGGGTAEAHEEGGTAVRTPFDPRLVPLATRWSGAGSKRAPHDLLLDGPRLRWWALAAGHDTPAGYVLLLGPQDELVWPAVGAALVRAGLTAQQVGPRAEGPAYRITGQRRVDRLRELIGERPEGVPPDAWL